MLFTKKYKMENLSSVKNNVLAYIYLAILNLLALKLNLPDTILGNITTFKPKTVYKVQLICFIEADNYLKLQLYC